MASLSESESGAYTPGQRSTCRHVPLAERNYVQVQQLKVCWAIRILVKAPGIDEVLCSETLNLFTRLLHLDTLRGKGMNPENLCLRRLVRSRPHRLKSKSDVQCADSGKHVFERGDDWPTPGSSPGEVAINSFE